MLMDLKLVKNSSMFCDESAYASVANWVNRHFEMMFVNLLGFEFVDEGEILGVNIKHGYNKKDSIDLLAKYHGILVNINRARMNAIQEVLINELNNNMPVLLLMNTFKCEWIKNKNRKFAYLLITGFDEEYFYCYDIHSNDASIKKLSRENWEDDIELEYRSFEIISEDKKINLDDIKECILNNPLINDNSIKGMLEFADCIENKINFRHEEMGEKDINNMPIFNNLMHILRSRKLAATAFGLSAEYNNCLMSKKYEQALIELGGDWNLVRNMLVKLYLFNKEDNKLLKYIAEKIRSIAKREEILFKCIKGEGNFVYSDFLVADIVVEKQKYLREYNLDIRSLYNNKAFESDSAIKADFTGHNEYFIKESEEGIKQIYYKDLCFDINEDYDNVTCENQEIEVNSDFSYNQILILGSSEWGEGYGYMDVFYADESKERLLINFSDWFYAKLDDSSIALRGKIIDSFGNEAQRAIFCMRFTLENDKKITKLQLPNVKNIHIFGIKMLFNDKI